MKKLLPLLTVLALGVMACGKDAAAPPAKEPEIATGKEPTAFQKSKMIGHYSTRDGSTGFIIDKTQDPIVVRLDGTSVNEPLIWHGAMNASIDYQSPSKKVWVRMSKETGDVLLFQGPKEHSGVEVVHDADAKSLH